MVGSPFNNSKLLERVLRARPDASMEEVRRLAPPLISVSDNDLKAQMQQIRLRTAPHDAENHRTRRSRRK